jgi:hypothetical protein
MEASSPPTDLRDPRSVSPKVVVPVVFQLLGVIALGIITGEFNIEEISVLGTALLTAILGYNVTDPARKGAALDY